MGLRQKEESMFVQMQFIFIVVFLINFVSEFVVLIIALYVAVSSNLDYIAMFRTLVLLLWC